MSACDFALGEYDGEASEFWDCRTIKARKQHKCCECGGVIQPGSLYESYTAKWDGEIQTNKTCSLCVEIRDKFDKGGGFTFTTLWEEIREYLFPEMNFNCMEGMSTEARNFIIQRWRAWKGLAAPATDKEPR